MTLFRWIAHICDRSFYTSGRRSKIVVLDRSSKQTLEDLPQNNLEIAKRTTLTWIIIIILFILLGINIGIIGMWLFV